MRWWPAASNSSNWRTLAEVNALASASAEVTNGLMFDEISVMSTSVSNIIVIGNTFRSYLALSAKKSSQLLAVAMCHLYWPRNSLAHIVTTLARGLFPQPHG